jgi:hypothetical protein
MNERAMGPVEGPLLRARLHVRGGKRRLRQGKWSAGIAALYDALSAAMEWFVAASERRQKIIVRPGDDLNSDRDLYRILVRSGVLDGSFDYDAFDRLVDRALGEEIDGGDAGPMVTGLESVMTQLGVLPFDEAALPPEDPRTF